MVTLASFTFTINTYWNVTSIKIENFIIYIYIYKKIHKWHETVPQIGNIYKTYKNI